MDDQVLARLFVDRAELAAALKGVARVTKPKSLEEVVFSFQGGELRLDCGGVTARAAATGDWPGRARVTWRHLQAAAVHLPIGDPVILSVGGGFLSVQRYRIACEWLPEVAIAGQLPLILLPLEPSLRELLVLRHRFAEADLAQSGHLPALLAAEKEMEKRIEDAWRRLAPLGIALEDIRILVQHSLRREARALGEVAG